MPVVVFYPDVQESGVKAAVRKSGVQATVGIDRYVQLDGVSSDGATNKAYGNARWHKVFVIDPTGTVRHFQTGLDGLQKVLGDG